MSVLWAKLRPGLDFVKTSTARISEPMSQHRLRCPAEDCHHLGLAGVPIQTETRMQLQYDAAQARSRKRTGRPWAAAPLLRKSASMDVRRCNFLMYRSETHTESDIFTLFADQCRCSISLRGSGQQDGDLCGADRDPGSTVAGLVLRSHFGRVPTAFKKSKGCNS